jgi:hypothetical protein
LVDEIVGEAAARKKRFPRTLGDARGKTGRRVALPFDAVWPGLRLMAEADEDQRWRALPHFDKPNRLTVSGVDQGAQRRMYDLRKRTTARNARYTVVEIPWERHPPPNQRNPYHDRERLRRIVQHAGVPLPEAHRRAPRQSP